MLDTGNDGLKPRPGSAPKLIEGPQVGNRSLYRQQVLDEDKYTEALSHIIGRDFFPDLPQLHATNDYLTALSNNDPELLSSSIRRLARIAEEKEGGRSSGGSSSRDRSEAELEAENARRRELEMAGTPYVSLGGRGRPHRTPLGARGWDTPRGGDTVRRRPAEAEDAYDMLDDDGAGPSRPSKRRKAPVVRDDLSLDVFQRNYTSEDNASFAQIVEEENRQRREERSAWAFEVERVAADRRIAGEERRKLILDAATSGGWRVDANGRRLIGGLAEGGTERTEGEAWKERKLITSGTAERPKDDNEEEEEGDPSDSKTALVLSKSGALIKKTDASASSALQPPAVTEEPLPEDHPLTRALVTAGLPPTALVSTKDGAIVPQREAVSGSGDGRGRGAEERDRRKVIEREVMGDEQQEVEPSNGGTDQWEYKAMNPLMFPPDAYKKPYPKPTDAPAVKARGAPPQITHANTRLPDEEDESGAASSRRASSVAGSWVDAAVKGTPYRASKSNEDYSLLPTDPDPTPEDLPPLMTWGKLLATPRALDDSGDPLDLSGPSFRLPDTKRRDDIGRKLGNKAGKSIADRAKAHAPRPIPSTPSLTDTLRAAAAKTRSGDRSVRGGPMLPPSTPRREGNLTPAARSLLDRTVGRTPQRGGLGALSVSARARSSIMEKGSGWGKSNVTGRSWTPSPAPRR